MIRAIILAATIATLICMYLDRPAPVQASEVKYCPITYRVAFKDRDGKWLKVWVNGWGQCKDMDRYEFV